MKIFLTGGTGFVGSHFLNHAASTDLDILALRRSAASQPRISLVREPEWLYRSFDTVVPSDINACDVLVHLATYSGNYPYDSLANCLQANLLDVLKLFETARIAGVRHFIVAGSCFEYGRSGERFDYIPSDAPLEPTNSYSASKAAASVSLTQWATEHHLSFELLRVFHVYGEGELQTRFWPSLKKAALSGQNFSMTPGNQIRDFQPVQSVAASFLNQIYARSTNPVLIHANLSTGKPRTMCEFAKYWWNHWQAKGDLLIGDLPYRTGEVMRYVPGDNIIYI